jgi:hypothetical protein
MTCGGVRATSDNQVAGALARPGPQRPQSASLIRFTPSQSEPCPLVTRTLRDQTRPGRAVGRSGFGSARMRPCHLLVGYAAEVRGDGVGAAGLRWSVLAGKPDRIFRLVTALLGSRGSIRGCETGTGIRTSRGSRVEPPGGCSGHTSAGSVTGPATHRRWSRASRATGWWRSRPMLGPAANRPPAPDSGAHSQGFNTAPARLRTRAVGTFQVQVARRDNVGGNVGAPGGLLGCLENPSICRYIAPVAQGIEHRIPNPGVASSNLAGGMQGIGSDPEGKAGHGTRCRGNPDGRVG